MDMLWLYIYMYVYIYIHMYIHIHTYIHNMYLAQSEQAAPKLHASELNIGSML